MRDEPRREERRRERKRERRRTIVCKDGVCKLTSSPP